MHNKRRGILRLPNSVKRTVHKKVTFRVGIKEGWGVESKRKLVPVTKPVVAPAPTATGRGTSGTASGIHGKQFVSRRFRTSKSTKPLHTYQRPHPGESSSGGRDGFSVVW
jgi:hypothetical protein